MQGPGPTSGAQDPYSGRKTLTQSAAPRLRAYDCHLATKLLTQDKGTFVLSELKAYIGSLGAIASLSNPTKH